MATVPPNKVDATVKSTLAMIEYAKPPDASDVATADYDARLHQALQILARSMLRQAQKQLEQSPDEPGGTSGAVGGEELDRQELHA